jgi:hypothetical protein
MVATNTPTSDVASRGIADAEVLVVCGYRSALSVATSRLDILTADWIEEEVVALSGKGQGSSGIGAHGTVIDVVK